MITPEVLQAIRPDLDDASAKAAAQKLDWAAPQFGINTLLRVAHQLAQLAHESGFKPVSENLSYSAKRLCEVWPNRFPTLQIAQRCANNPVALANTVYAGRLGNGGPESGDGWAYRGWGFLQLTGRGNYRTYVGLIGYDLEHNPDLLLQYGISALVAGAYWKQRGLNGPADRDDLALVTRSVNGGLTGLADRAVYLQRVKRALGI